MSSVKRRVNSTGRKRIPHARVRVLLDPIKPNQPLAATPNIDLQGMDFAVLCGGSYWSLGARENGTTVFCRNGNGP